MSDFDKSEYRFESAEYDLQTARPMLATGRPLYVGFSARTIEKALKGLFVSRKLEDGLPYLHKLRWLANLSGISGGNGTGAVIADRHTKPSQHRAQDTL